MESRYETPGFLAQYLLFHYGSEQDQQPFDFGLQQALNFPVRCISECVDTGALSKEAVALDIGCAVGRSTFEFSRYCQQTVGIDSSQSFIHAAKQLQKYGQIEYSLLEEGSQTANRIAYLPPGIDPSGVEFIHMDAMDLFQSKRKFHVVLVANLICRLPDPEAFLGRIHSIVASSGQLIIISPYSWLEEFTPRNKWLKGENGLSSLKNILNKHFNLKKVFDMPFLMREHLRKYQLGVSQASIWIKI
jgi:putative 4-mercaptohistidine N1-methyltranferase